MCLKHLKRKYLKPEFDFNFFSFDHRENKPDLSFDSKKIKKKLDESL